MIFSGWQANATGEDVEASLLLMGAYDIKSSPPSSNQEYPEFQWTAACDADEDIVSILGQMLWYNDRSDEDVKKAQEEVRTLLRTYGRKTEP